MSYRAIAVVIAALVMMVCAVQPASAQAQVERGMKVFADSKCSLCHSVAGKGNVKGPLNDVGARLSAAEMREWLTHPDVMREKTKAERKPPMKSFASLSKDDMDALVAYLQTLKTK